MSDLSHILEVARNSPGEARRLLGSMVRQLRLHHDDEFAARLSRAGDKMLDNPPLAMQIVAEVIGVMSAAIREHDEEKDNPWQKK
jgi:hypothetical protein